MAASVTLTQDGHQSEPGEDGGGGTGFSCNTKRRQYVFLCFHHQCCFAGKVVNIIKEQGVWANEKCISVLKTAFPAANQSVAGLYFNEVVR